LRITVEVKQGVASYVFECGGGAPPGGATANASDPIPERESLNGQAETESATREPTIAAAAMAIAGPGGEDDLPDSIEYPFTLLSIQEIDAADHIARLAQAFEVQ
jgi:hypothetical protein